MSLFNSIKDATNAASNASSFIQRGARLIDDVVGVREDKPFNNPVIRNEQDFEDEDERSAYQAQANYSRTRSRSDDELLRMAKTNGGVQFLMMKSASDIAKALISRILINRSSDEETIAKFERFKDMANDEGVSVYQFQPTEQQLEELGIADKTALVNEGRKAEKKNDLLEKLDKEQPDVDEVFKDAIIEALYHKYKEQDERGELQADSVMTVVMNYMMVQVGSALTDSGYSVVDMVMDLIGKKKPIGQKTPIPKPSVKDTTDIPIPIVTDEERTDDKQELASNWGEEHG